MTAAEATLFDTHCHLTAAAFAGEVEAVLARAREAGLAGLVTIASSADDAETALQLAQAHADVWSTAGIHPHDAAATRTGDLSRIRDLCQEPRVVALGETGLDYHYDNSPRDVQRRLLDAHIEMAVQNDLPLVLHSRSAEADTAAAVRAAAAAGARGVLHCFAGNAALLDAALEADWYISFAGLITFKRFEGEDLLRAVPRERLLIETDAPYLAPVPRRGQRNEPAYVAHTCEAAAALRGESPAELARSTMDNARRFYNLSGAVAPRP